MQNNIWGATKACLEADKVLHTHYHNLHVLELFIKGALLYQFCSFFKHFSKGGEVGQTHVGNSQRGAGKKTI